MQDGSRRTPTTSGWPESSENCGSEAWTPIEPPPPRRSRTRSIGESSRVRWRRTCNSGWCWRDSEHARCGTRHHRGRQRHLEGLSRGRATVYGKDEFGLLFELGTGPEPKRRFTRYSPLESKSTDASLAELTQRQLVDLFQQSQPAWTSPEGGYGVR